MIESLIKLIYFYSFELKATNDLLQEQSKDIMIIKLKCRDKTRGLISLTTFLLCLQWPSKSSILEEVKH